MARGFLSGFVVGAAVSLCAAAIVSHVAGPPVPPEVSVDVPAAGIAPSGSHDMAGRVPGPGERDPLQPATSMVDAPEVESEAAIADEATRSAGRPETGAAGSGVEEPAPDERPGGVVVDGMTPVAPNPQADAPIAPDTDRQAVISTDPPRPGGADIAASDPGPGGDTGLQMPDAEAAGTPVAPGRETAVTDMGAKPSAPGTPDQPDSPALPADPAPRPEADAEGPPGAQDTTGSPDLTGNPQVTDARSGAEGSGRAEAPGMADAPESEDTPRTSGLEDTAGSGAEADAAGGIAVLPQAGTTGDTAVAPSVGTPATSLLDREPGENGTGGAGDGPPRDAEIATDAGARDPALLRNAEPFAIPDDQPLMSIILMDTGQSLDDSPVGLAALGSFPYPLSFAVDASLPDAAERAERYRAAGREVLALVNLPPNLTASDTEVALTATLARLPQAVGVLEGPGTGLQGSSELARQVSAILQDTGHGIVWQPNGLDAAQRMAARSGVASQTLYRDFDSGGETPVVISRFLDQAAFRAGQEGSVIMIGRVRPDTISALLLWGLQDRARRVAVAPVSAVLRAGQEGG